MRRIVTILVICCLLLCASILPANAPTAVHTQQHLDEPTRMWSMNWDGSCVLLSLSMCGSNAGNIQAAAVCFDTRYGPAERGGAWPSRMTQVMNARGIKGWNVVGQKSPEWIDWSIRTGRFAAIGAGTQHFQTAWGYDPTTNHYLVCNNQHPQTIDRYTPDQFLKLHFASGPWCIILDRPCSEAPEPIQWWE